MSRLHRARVLSLVATPHAAATPAAATPAAASYLADAAQSSLLSGASVWGSHPG